MSAEVYVEMFHPYMTEVEFEDRGVTVALSSEEAWELLLRAMKSEERDNPAFTSALRKLAHAVEGKGVLNSSEAASMRLAQS